MAIIRRQATDGKTRYQVRIPLIDPATGNEAKRTFGTYRTLREAEREERNAIIARDNGTLLKPTRMTVGELLDEWVRVELPRRVKSENREGYEGVIRTHLKPRFGNVQVRALTVRMVESFYAELEAAGKSSSLIKKCHMRLNSALQMAKRWGMVQSVVTEAANVPAVKYGEKPIWEADEVARFLTASTDDMMHPIWRLALESGARTSELLGLTWADFDAEAGTVRVGRQVVRLEKGHPIVRQGGKTQASLRVNQLTAEMVEALSTHRAAQNTHRLAAPEWIDNDLIFCTRTGRPINARFFRKHFDGIVEDAGVTEIGPHGMRRTAITLAIQSGANPKALAEWVGHRDVSTTIRIYQRVTQTMNNQLVGIMGGIVGSADAAPTPEDVPIAIDRSAG